jgi:hypothetical protein
MQNLKKKHPEKELEKLNSHLCDCDERLKFQKLQNRKCWTCFLKSKYLGYLPTDFYEIYNADILDREGSISSNKITSS